jgi:acyl-CoA hydrolase
MQENAGIVMSDVRKCVDEVINHVGKNITIAMTLALGKPNLFINELYRRAKEDPTITLKIVTALVLEIPHGHTELEKRFLKPLAERVFDGVPEIDYMVDYRNGVLPGNVESFEFFGKAGGYLHDPVMQQNHISGNYTDACRDAIDFGVNVFGQLISLREEAGEIIYSMGCNTDLCIEAIQGLKLQRRQGRKVAIIGEANRKLPFMYGDAVVAVDSYDMILQGPEFDYELFSPPKDAVAPADHMIGLNVSTLVRDGGTIQVGIGALGDAIVAGLIMRNEHNDVYQEIINKIGLPKRYENLIKKWGDTSVFQKGLYGSSEMFVDAFMQMYKKKILKRKVFESIPLMKLINAGKLTSDNIPDNTIDNLLEIKGIHAELRRKDFDFLTYYGILKSGLVFEDGFIFNGDERYSANLKDEANRVAIRKLLGSEMKHGMIILAAFFVGPKAFYKALNDMSEEERQQFGMSGVEMVNQLYGGEELRTLQRIDARFINTGMVVSLLGAIASDQLEDGRVVSGMGGQYNFVAMSNALRDSRLIMLIKSTKGAGRKLKSNVVFSYGHCTVTRHMRDIIVTEYGIADVRGKPDKDVIAAILNIADSRFQDKLLAQAKAAKKIPDDYQIPAEYRNNTPEKIAAQLKPYQKQGYFQPYPFGTDLNQDDIALGGSLKALKNLGNGYPLKLACGLIAEMFRPIPEGAIRHLERMKLMQPASFMEKIYRKMVVFALRTHGCL